MKGVVLISDFCYPFGATQRTSERDANLPFVCRNCGKRYKMDKTMIRHRKKCEGVFHYNCSVCGKQYYRRDLYREHLYSRHRMVEPNVRLKPTAAEDEN